MNQGANNICILVQIQGTPGWVDEPVWGQDG